MMAYKTVNEIISERDVLLDALERLTSAAERREITMGDQISLIVVKEELASAARHAKAVIAEVSSK